jgi:hypothetical protein
MPLSDGKVTQDGTSYSRASVRLIVVDAIIQFVGEVSHSQKLESAFGYGMNRSQGPMAQSAGKLTPGGLKLKGFKGGVQKMRELVAELSESGTCYGTPMFPLFIQYIDANESPIDEEFFNCKWEEESSSITDSPDCLQDELSFTFWRKKTNGLSLHDDSEEL